MTNIRNIVIAGLSALALTSGVAHAMTTWEHFTATYAPDPTDLSLYGDLTVTNGVITDVTNGGGVSVNVPFTITALKCGYGDYGSPNCDLPLTENGVTFGTDNAGDMNLFSFNNGFYVDESRYDPTGGDFSAVIPVTLTVTPTGVPEPASWALMLVGFGIAGSALRSGNRRRAMIRVAA